MIISGFLVGYGLDYLIAYFFKIQTMPIFMLSCGLLGFIGGTQKVKQLLSKMDLLDPTISSKKVDTHDTK
jgi:ATP synthase protein I